MPKPPKEVFKNSDDFCGHLRWMIDKKIVSITNVVDTEGPDFSMPIIREALPNPLGFVVVRYCPDCGQPTFNIVDDALAPQENHV